MTENGFDVTLNPRDLRSLTPRRRRVPFLDVQVAGRRLRPASRRRRRRRRRRCRRRRRRRRRRYHRSLSFPVCKQSKRILTGLVGQTRAKGKEALPDFETQRFRQRDLRRAA